MPEWYKNAIWMGVVIAVGGLTFTAMTGDNTTPPSTFNAGPNVENLPTPGEDQSVGTGDTSFIQIRGLDGASYEVPQQAFDAAAAAGLALWTGDWTGVPITGELPDTAAVFPRAQLGGARVITAEEEAVSFLFELDENGTGRTTQEFQVTVVSTSDGWAYPAFGG